MNGTIVVAMCTLALGASLAAQTGPLDTSAAVPAAFFTASESGLQFVLRAQNRDGSWGDEPGAPGDLGNTAWAAMSLLALGHTPTRGQHAFAVRRAVDWLLYHTRGFDVNPPQFRMGTLLQRKLGNNADLYLTCLGYTQLIGMNVDASDDDRMRAELSGMCRAISWATCIISTAPIAKFGATKRLPSPTPSSSEKSASRPASANIFARAVFTVSRVFCS